jgi:Zn-dependent M16 (insulinase) family peptidase
MKLEPGKVYRGFLCKWAQEIPEVNSLAYYLVHEKTKAELCYLANEDPNKVFMIGFKTPPEDSFGTPHILEHSVLNGSKNFPAKDTFTELIKGSMKTFINAFTASDHTMYPIASTNDKDFLNLMTVYLDAVFNPMIYDRPEIFWQEGWHYELENKDAPLTYKGVVYNEMRGAFSSPESILFRSIQSTQNPDNAYQHESGGDPDVIPQLSYEKFLNFHQKYYHPGNSYIYLFGDMNIDETLKIVDEQYLSQFDYKEFQVVIEEQASFKKMIESTIKYPVSPNESTEDKDYFALTYTVGHLEDEKLNLAMNIISDVLLTSEAAVLKRAILEAGLAKDVIGSFDDGILQPALSIVLKNTSASKKEKFLNLVQSTLENLVKEGINKELIEACINRREFVLREADMRGFPIGLFYSMMATKGWIHGYSPLKYLAFDEALQDVKRSLTEPYLEGIIEKYLLNSDHMSFILMQPEQGLADKKSADTAAKKASMNEQEINEIVELTQKLVVHQTTPDNPADLEKIPLLELSDLDRQSKPLPFVKKEVNGVTLIAHPTFSNGIIYLNSYFNLANLTSDEFAWFGLLSELVGKMDTKQLNYADLSNQVNIHTGGIGTGASFIREALDINNFSNWCVLESKAKNEKLPELLKLTRTIIQDTLFDNEERLHQLLMEIKSRREMRMMSAGHGIALTRAGSYHNPSSYLQEIYGGLSFYQFVTGLEKNFTERKDEIIAKLNDVMRKAFNRNNLIISVTCDESDLPLIENSVQAMCEAFYTESYPVREWSFAQDFKNEGLMAPTNVQYAALVGNLIEKGYKYSGSMRVMSNILRNEFLYNQIRVQGGAYGAMFNMDSTGQVNFASYRDPNLGRTYEVYKGCGEFLRNFKCSDRDLAKYIIGAVSPLDNPITPSQLSAIAMRRYLCGITEEMVQKDREELLDTKISDINAQGDMLDAVVADNIICTFGNSAKINEEKDIFKNLVNVFE